MLTNSQISDLLEPYGIEASPQLTGKVSAYVELLLRWNRKIALTTVTDPAEILKFHFGESLFAISTGVCGKSRLADVGTGAGFPGLALALADPALQVTLIESNLKKCAFLSEVIRQLAIPNATVFAKRMESLDQTITGLDWIAARALGQFDDLLAWAKTRLRQGGHLLLWLGGDDVRKLSSAAEWNWEQPAQIPGTERRFILKGVPSVAASGIVPRGTN